MMAFNLCGATSPHLRLWETHAMLMTPLDYWRTGMDLWFKTAEMQIDMGFRMMAAMQGWDVVLASTRSLSDERVTLKPTARRAATAPNAAPAPAGPASATTSPINPAVSHAPPPETASKPAPSPARETPAATSDEKAPANKSAAPSTRRRRAPSAPAMPSAFTESKSAE